MAQALPRMSIEPLLATNPVVILHAFGAMAAFLMGIIQFVRPKGTTTHRVVGWSWVLLMVTVAASSFWIRDLRQFGPFSWIHGLSIFTLVMLPVAVARARLHDIDAHKKTMIGIFLGALVVAGLFTLLPGRIMHAVVFSGI